MEWTKGMIVRALAGKEKGGWYVVVALGDGYAAIADGDKRRIDAPKRKSFKHLCATKTSLPLENLTDKGLRGALKQYANARADVPMGGSEVVKTGRD